MIFPVYTSLATAILVILLMGLGLYTSMGRLKFSQSVGHGDHDELEKRMRFHGNLAEHAALTLLGLALLEASGADQDVVKWLCIWLVVARILHPIGLAGKPGPNPLRFFGGSSTYMIGVISGIWLTFVAISRLA